MDIGHKTERYLTRAIFAGIGFFIGYTLSVLLF